MQKMFGAESSQIVVTLADDTVIFLATLHGAQCNFTQHFESLAEAHAAFIIADWGNCRAAVEALLPFALAWKA